MSDKPWGLVNALENLFGVAVSSCVATPEMAFAPLAPAEHSRISHAGAARRAEFTAGRAAARCALAKLGLHGVAVPSQHDRSPLWPPGHVGSITHCEGFCAAVATTTRHAASVGLDAELAQPLPAEVQTLVCGPDDVPHAASTSLRASPIWATVVFSAKEAAYKCQFPLLHELIEFDVASILWGDEQDACGGRFSVRFGPAAPDSLKRLDLQGAWRIRDGLILTGVWQAAF